MSDNQRRAALRDGRRTDWFYLDNALMDETASKIGIYALGVYTYLCRKAGDGDSAYPGVKTIAKALAISERQVQRSLNTLADHGLLVIEREERPDGGNKPNTYVLYAPPSASQSPGGDSAPPPPGDSQSPEEYTGGEEYTEKNMSPTGETSSPPNFDLFCKRKSEAGIEVTPEDRDLIAGNLEKFRKKHGEQATYQVIAQMVSRAVAGLPPKTPQSAWALLTAPGNGGASRANGHQKPSSNGGGAARESEYLAYFAWRDDDFN